MTRVSLSKQPSTPPTAGAQEVCVEAAERGEGYVARAELVLGRAVHRSLGQMSLEPDPLQLVAAAMAPLTADGEDLQVAIDLLPVGEDRVARRRRRLMRRAERRGPTAFGERLRGGASGGGAGGRVVETLMAGLNGGQAPAWTRGGGTQVPRQADLADGVGKLTPDAQVFAVQVLVRATGRHPAAVRARLHQALAALQAQRGENFLRPVGPRRGPQWWRVYSNAGWRRRSFDRRWASGEHGRRRQWVTVPEVAGWLKPPSAACAADNVRRGGGRQAPAPAGLVTWRGQPGVVPHGLARGADGRQRLVATPSSSILFGASLGQAGYGKTELALLQALTLAYGGDGTWFLDPHGDALRRARPYMTHAAVRERVWEIDLADPHLDTPMPTWNPLDMRGRREEEIQEVIGSIVGAIASAQGWGEGAPRARAILSHAVLLLAHMAAHQCAAGRPELQPTVFQIKTLVLDDDWRDQLLALLPAELAGRLRKFWRGVFPRYGLDAVTTVVNTLERLENSLSLRAFLGSPLSSYSAREAMDTRRVVWLCPSGTGEADQVITSLLLFDLFRAGLSRRDTAREQRPTQWAFLDELTAIDGASHGYVAKILEQLRKYEIRLMGMTQMAMRLSAETRQALMQNQNLLATTRGDVDEAAFLAKRLRGVDAEAIQRLERYRYLVTTTLDGHATPAFEVAGVPIDQVLADYYRPDQLPLLDRAVDASLTRRPVRDILAGLDALDEAVLTPPPTTPTTTPPARAGFNLAPGGTQ